MSKIKKLLPENLERPNERPDPAYDQIERDEWSDERDKDDLKFRMEHEKDLF